MHNKKEMLTEFRNAIFLNIENNELPTNFKTNIESCWKFGEDISEIDQEIGPLLMWSLWSRSVTENFKNISYRLLNNVAPENILFDLTEYIKVNDTEISDDQKLAAVLTVLHIRTLNKLKSFDIGQVISLNKSLFNETSPALSHLVRSLTILYPYDYPKAKTELQSFGLFELSQNYKYGNGLFDFFDPRALEDDSKYSMYMSPSSSWTTSRMFTSLSRHLELKFKPEWLRRLQTDELRILRNAIYASHGYVFSDPVIGNYFKDTATSHGICRDGQCGTPNIAFHEDSLTATDKENISLIKNIENQRQEKSK
jgi:hypothetical protein